MKKRYLKLLNPFKRASNQGFIVEQLSPNRISGWLVLPDWVAPDRKCFYLFDDGNEMDFEVDAFHRRDLTGKEKTNVFGFRIRFIGSSSHTINLFYLFEKGIMEPQYLDTIELKNGGQHSRSYYLNYCAMLAKKLGHTPNSLEIPKPSEECENPKKKPLTNKIDELVTSDVSAFHLQSGIKSPSGAAITGKNGHIFLFGGSNKVDKLYHDSCVDLAKIERWKTVFSKRELLSEKLGFQYLQIIIPEKQSLIPNDYFRPLEDVSGTLKALDVSTYPYYFSVQRAMSQYSHKELFFKTDSHLNSYGTFLLFSEILAYLGFEQPFSPRFSDRRQICGDLGRKYAPMKLWEIALYPSKVTYPSRHCKSKFVPPTKGHMGRTIHWECPDAPIAKRIMIFGNSFFEMGKHAHHLTWWFSHVFQECIFVWSSDFNHKYIAKYQPDIVVGQTIERFLRLTPKH